VFQTFRPGKGETAVALVLIVVCLVLGMTQISDRGRRADTLNHALARMGEKAVPLPEKILNPGLWEYRRVRMAGQFIFEHEFLLRGRLLDGENGYHVLTPFQRASGGIVFVDRGWISAALIEKANRPKGTVSVDGIVQVAVKPSWSPENEPEKDIWYWPDVKTMAAASYLKGVAPIVVTDATRVDGVYPAGGQVRLDIPPDHRKYATFWFGLAGLILLIWGIASFTEKTCPPTSVRAAKPRI
jgi:surfeit locus 1 family protein